MVSANVNVRGQASVFSEVVGRLKEGDRVVILEDITLGETRAGNPTNWVRIALPADTFVWVHSSYVDPATKQATPKLLNARSGPGENFSVLGQIPQGTVIKDLEVKGPWLRIQPTPNLYAFLASYLVGRADAPSTLAPAASRAPTAPAPVAVVPSPVTPPSQLPPTPVEPAESIAVATPPATTPATVPVITPTEPSSANADPLPLPPIEPAEVSVPPATGPIEPEVQQLVKRIVSREGIVRRSVSIQAPTEFTLENAETRKTVNYLFPSPGKNITLRGFEGQRILVTGEELVDIRWPNTPVLNIDSLRSKP